MDTNDEEQAAPRSAPRKPKTTKRRRTSWRRLILKVVVPLLVVGVAAGGAYLWWKSMNGANFGSVQNTPPSTILAPEDRPVEYTVLDLQKVQLSYPKNFLAQTNQPKQPDLIDYRVLTAPTTQTNDRAQIGVTLKTAKVPLVEDSAYRFYSEKKSTYDIKTQTIQGDTVYVATARGTFGRIIFWQHAGTVLIVAVTAQADPRGLLAEQSQKLLTSIAWQ